jgi:KDO2-lipid IV(A) lauroyltransferase
MEGEEKYPAWWDIRYLPVRMLFFLLRLAVLLPLPIIYFLGDAVGLLMRLVLRRRYRIARRNLELCYPDMSSDEIKHLLRQNFSSMGRAVFETGMAWYWSDDRVRRHMDVSEESIKNIMDYESCGQLVLTCHFLDLEMHARMYALFHPGVGVYKPNRNPVIERKQTEGRTRANKYMVSHRNVRGIIKALKEGNPIWYAADQDYRTHSRVFVPFMAVPDCPTVTAPSTLARVKNVVSIPSYAYRLPGGKYRLVVQPKLENYPTGDLEQDATTYNKIMADAINEAPEQYMWVHCRFKTRPHETDPSYYESNSESLHRK